MHAAAVVIALTDNERKLLDRLAAEGRATTVYADDFKLANGLQSDGLVFLVRDRLGRDAASAHNHAEGETVARPARNEAQKGRAANVPRLMMPVLLQHPHHAAEGCDARSDAEPLAGGANLGMVSDGGLVDARCHANRV